MRTIAGTPCDDKARIAVLLVLIRQAHRLIEEERTRSLRRIHARNTVALGLILAGQVVGETHAYTRRFAYPSMFH
jgi:hypothetical protein